MIRGAPWPRGQGTGQEQRHGSGLPAFTTCCFSSFATSQECESYTQRMRKAQFWEWEIPEKGSKGSTKERCIATMTLPISAALLVRMLGRGRRRCEASRHHAVGLHQWVCQLALELGTIRQPAPTICAHIIEQAEPQRELLIGQRNHLH